MCQDNKKCLDLEEVCDGTPECIDRSDEGNLCDLENLDCVNGGMILKHPLGPRCLCNKGFEYDEEGCSDIDECEEAGICSQECVNTFGSYECTCWPGYQLDATNNTCVPSAPYNTQPAQHQPALQPPVDQPLACASQPPTAGPDIMLLLKSQTEMLRVIVEYTRAPPPPTDNSAIVQLLTAQAQTMRALLVQNLEVIRAITKAPAGKN